MELELDRALEIIRVTHAKAYAGWGGMSADPSNGDTDRSPHSLSLQPCGPVSLQLL